MKKVILCLLAAATAVACSKDETTTPAANPEDLVLTFGAGTEATDVDPEAASVRAGYDGTNSIWHAGDAVSLTLDNVNNNNLKFTQVGGTLSSDSRRVQYTGTLNQAVTGNVTAISYFPHSTTATISNSTVTTTFPATQPYVANGYKNIPLFSKYTGDIKALKLNYNNLFSIVKLTLNKGISLPGTVNLQKIIFKGNNNEVVSGAMVVNMSGATPVVSYTGTGKTVTLDLGAGVPLTTLNQTFYMAVPAINYTNGYSFTFVTDQGQVTKSAKNTGANYVKNKIYAAPALTINSLSLVSIPDGNLRNALADLGLISILDPLNNIVSITTAGLQAASINVAGKNITDLTGIELFPALVSLSAGNNNIATVDLSKLTLLTNLDLSHNQLTSLNLAANTLLTSINLSGNQLTGLNLAANLALLSLDVSSNALTSLDLHNNILLTTLKVYGNPLITLNISGLKALLSLNLVNGVESINTVTKTLTIPAAATVQNIISDGVALTNWLNFVCNNNPNVVSISLKNNTGLLSVTATGNTSLASLDVSGNLTLAHVDAHSNALTTLNLTGDTALLTLNAASNKLASINLAGQTAMTTLDVSSNLLTNLDLHNNILLTSLKCYGNTLVTLNLSGLNALNALYLNSTGTNAIASLKLTIPTDATIQNFIFDGVSVASLWTSFECSNNPTIQSISINNNVKLLSATVTNNSSLTSLDLSGNILQTMLRAHGTGTSILTTLNISGMKALNTLYFSSLNNNCFSLLTLTIPPSTKIKNIIADGTLLVATWTRFVCSNNQTVEKISLKNNLGLLGVTVTNNNSLSSLVITGSGLGLTGVTSSGNAAGFTVTP